MKFILPISSCSNANWKAEHVFHTHQFSNPVAIQSSEHIELYVLIPSWPIGYRESSLIGCIILVAIPLYTYCERSHHVDAIAI